MHWSLGWNVVSLQEQNKCWERMPMSWKTSSRQSGNGETEAEEVVGAKSNCCTGDAEQKATSSIHYYEGTEWQQCNLRSAWLITGTKQKGRRGRREERKTGENTEQRERTSPKKQTYRAWLVLVWAAQLSQQQGRPPTPDVLQSLPALHRTIKRLQITMPAMLSPTGVSPLTCH